MNLQGRDTGNHSVILRSRKRTITVSCKCRTRTGNHSKAGKPYAEPIGETRNWNETVALYNDPENHWAPFEEKDRIGRGNTGSTQA